MGADVSLAMAISFPAWCGIVVNHGVFFENEDWLRVYGLNSLEEPDPEIVLPEIFQWVQSAHETAGLKGTPPPEPCLAFNSKSQHLFLQEWFNTIFASTREKFPYFPIIFHVPFTNRELPLGPDFKATLITHLKSCAAMDVSATVIHPPNTDWDSTAQVVDELADPDITRAILETGIPVCIENAQPGGTHFQSLQNLIELRKTLLTRVPELTEQVKFCFDTGHYLLYQQRDGGGHGDWNEWGVQFLEETVVVHVQANAGGRDRHYLPCAEVLKCIPAEAFAELDKKIFAQNCAQVLYWLREANAIWAGKEKPRYLVYEVRPYFTQADFKNFWKNWAE